MRYFVTIDDHEHAVEVTELPNGSYQVRLCDDADDRTADAPLVDADVVARDGLLSIRLDGKMLDLVVDGELPTLEVFASGRRASVSIESDRTRAAGQIRGRKGGAGDGVVASPMPGKVVKLLVSEGDEVDAGAPLVVVEAMKMENELCAERSGVVSKIFVAPGDAVEGGARLVSVS